MTTAGFSRLWCYLLKGTGPPPHSVAQPGDAWDVCVETGQGSTACKRTGGSAGLGTHPSPRASQSSEQWWSTAPRSPGLSGLNKASKEMCTSAHETCPRWGGSQDTELAPRTLSEAAANSGLTTLDAGVSRPHT